MRHMLGASARCEQNVRQRSGIARGIGRREEVEEDEDEECEVGSEAVLEDEPEDAGCGVEDSAAPRGGKRPWRVSPDEGGLTAFGWTYDGYGDRAPEGEGG